MKVPHQSRLQAAFTLVEVILAIVIALGILVVLLFFYQQATNLRAQAILETERLSAARLVMNRITGELRAIQAGSFLRLALVGHSNAIEFVKADVPSFSAWLGGPMGRSAFPVTDLKLVRYSLQTDGTNATGLVRTEEPLVEPVGKNPFESLATNNLSGIPFAPVLEEIQFLQFRYWTGTNWADEWGLSRPPLGVEVTLGAEAMTNVLEAAEAEAELFRRVVYIPAQPTPAKTSVALRIETDDSAEVRP